MKTYKITYYKDGVKYSLIIEASNRWEALRKAWSLVVADDIYASEVTNNDGE